MPATVTLSTVISYARTLAKTDSNDLTDALAIAYANDVLFDVYCKYNELRKDLAVQESVRDITSDNIEGGSEPGKFLWPSDMWMLKEIIINLTDPTSQDLWNTSRQVDVSNLPAGVDFEWLRKNQSTLVPVHDNRGDWFEIFPTPLTALEDAMKIHYWLAPTLFTATSDTLAYPFNINPYILSYLIAGIHLDPNSPDLALKRMNKGYALLEGVMSSIGAGEQKPIAPQAIPWTGQEF